MPNIKTKVPVNYNKEDYPANFVIPDVEGKIATRLVRLGAAEYTTETATSFKPDDIPPGDDDAEENDGGSGDGDTDDVKAMKKAELIKALAEAGVKLTGEEKVGVLREMLTRAWDGEE